MIAGTIIQSGDLSFWFDGQPSSNLQNSTTILGDLSFWFDGEVYATIYPPTTVNNLNGGFFFFM